MSSTMVLDSIDRLLAPLSWHTFLAQHYGRRPLRIAGGEDKVRGFLSWAHLNEALETHRIASPRLLVARDRKTVDVVSNRRDRRGQIVPHLDVAALYRHLRDGHTLVLYAIDEIVATVRALSDALGRRFGRGAQANVFASWGRQGNGIHLDAHEVFVVQVSGRKRWRFYGATGELPMERDEALGVVTPPPTTVVEEIEVAPGDVLYIPRGHWHDVNGVGEPTLHVSFGIENPTGLDLVDWMARTMPAGDPFQRHLPRFAGAAERARHMRALRDHLLAQLDDDALERYLACNDANLRAGRRVNLPEAAIGDGLPAGDDVVVASTVLASPEVRAVDGDVVFTAFDREWRTGPGTDTLLRLVLADRPWQLRELLAAPTGLGEDRVRAVLAELFANGLVRVV